jgi:hypothetical protein
MLGPNVINAARVTPGPADLRTSGAYRRLDVEREEDRLVLR